MRKREGSGNKKNNKVEITERKQKEKAPLAATPEFRCLVVFRGLFPCGLNFVFYVLFFADCFLPLCGFNSIRPQCFMFY